MQTFTNVRPVQILLVEDNPGDVRLTIEALKEAKVLNQLTVVKDGIEALSLLRRQGQYARAPRPDLILLDLNLPKKDGREVLGEIKADDNLKHIPVVILTTSQDEQDMLKIEELQPLCQLLYDEAGGCEPVHHGREIDRRLLAGDRGAAGG